MKDLIIKVSIILPNGTGDYTFTVPNIHHKVRPAHISPGKVAGMLASGLRQPSVKITTGGQTKKEPPKPVKPQGQTLKEKAEALGIKVDGRWSVSRIEEEIGKKTNTGVTTFKGMNG